MALSLAEQVALLPPDERDEALRGLDPEALVWDWSFFGRPEQQFPDDESFDIGVYLAGRGSGKTRAAAEWIREKAKKTNEGRLRFLLVARTAADARQVMVSGESGILAVSPPSERPEYKPSIRELIWPNGNSAFITTADEPDSLRGPQAPLALDTPILTTRGWTTMRDTTTEDYVFDERGLPSRVTRIHPIQRAESLYRISFSDGTYIDADGNHLWPTLTAVDTSRLDRIHGRQIIVPTWASYEPTFTRKDSIIPAQQRLIYEMTAQGDTKTKIMQTARVSIKQVKYWRNKFKTGTVPGYPSTVKTTSEIAKTISSRHQIPASPALNIPSEPYALKLPLHPWVLGLVLGDGATRQPGTIASNAEDIDFTVEKLTELGYPARERKNHKIAALGITKVWDTAKFIPEEFFMSSYEDRLALVQGLTDSDGGVEDDGAFRFFNTNKSLVDGYVRLCRSLGLIPRVYSKPDNYRYDVPTKPSWYVHVYSDVSLVTLPRKVERFVPRNSRANFTRTIRSVDLIPARDVRCITVDSPNHLFLAGEGLIPTANSYSWADEIAAWRLTPDKAGMTAWQNLRVATRLGKNPQIIATTTPKRVPVLFDLLEEEKKTGRVLLRRGSTYDNAGNLGAAYLNSLEAQFGHGSQQARQELFGEMLDAIDGALWTDEMITDARYMSLKPPFTPLRLVGVDPSVAENPKDECGIVVVGSTNEPDLYRRNAWVIEDLSIKGSPTAWAQVVVDAARRWQCPVVAEVNQGGALVRNAIHQIDPSITVLEVFSKQGKKLRAEPITLAYTQRRVHHLNVLGDLETQMTTWMPELSSKSPDRVDALVHALTALLIKPPKGFTGGSIQAKSVASRRIQMDPTARRPRPGLGTFRVR